MTVVEGIVDGTTEGSGDRDGNVDGLREGATVSDGFLVSAEVGFCELLGWGDGSIEGETLTDGTVLGCDVRLGLNLVGDNVIELGRILGTEDGGDVGVPEGAEELSPPFSITTIDKKL